MNRLKLNENSVFYIIFLRFCVLFIFSTIVTSFSCHIKLIAYIHVHNDIINYIVVGIGTVAKR